MYNNIDEVVYPRREWVKKGVFGTVNAQEANVHIVRPSSWPLLVAVFLASVLFALVLVSHGKVPGVEGVGKSCWTIGWVGSTTILGVSVLCWLYEVHLEGAVEGWHTNNVQRNLLFGFGLFIVSEVSLFVSMFWAFFHSAVNPSIFIGESWPPLGIQPLNPWSLPLVNTVLLLSSGVSVTLAHHSWCNAELLYVNLEKLNSFLGVSVSDELKFRDIAMFVDYFDKMDSDEFFCSTYSYKDEDEEYYDEWSRRFSVEFIIEEIMDETTLIYVWLEVGMEYQSLYDVWYEELEECVGESGVAKFFNEELGWWYKSRYWLQEHNVDIKLSLSSAIVYGVIFSCFQFYEYTQTMFDISDSVYGSTFFMLTGLHGLHVLVGTCFLGVQLSRYMYGAVLAGSSPGFVSSIWYWHFVDIVWLFVFLLVYVWGALGYIDEIDAINPEPVLYYSLENSVVIGFDDTVTAEEVVGVEEKNVCLTCN